MFNCCDRCYAVDDRSSLTSSFDFSAASSATRSTCKRTSLRFGAKSTEIHVVRSSFRPLSVRQNSSFKFDFRLRIIRNSKQTASREWIIIITIIVLDRPFFVASFINSLRNLFGFFSKTLRHFRFHTGTSGAGPGFVKHFRPVRHEEGGRTVQFFMLIYDPTSDAATSLCTLPLRAFVRCVVRRDVAHFRVIHLPATEKQQTIKETVSTLIQLLDSQRPLPTRTLNLF